MSRPEARQSRDAWGSGVQTGLAARCSASGSQEPPQGAAEESADVVATLDTVHDDPDELQPLPPASQRGWIHPSELGPRPEPVAPRQPRSPLRSGLAGAMTVGVVTVGVFGLLAMAVATSGRVSGTTQRLDARDPLGTSTAAMVTIDVRATADSDPSVRASGISLGSGIVVTSASLVAGEASIRINGAPASIMLTDATTDIAVMRTSLSLAPARLASAARLETGDLLTVATESANAHGTVRALRTPTNDPAGAILETDIAPSPRSPGSAALDETGAVAGIVSSFRTPAGHLVVVPIDTVRNLVDHAGRGALASDPNIGVTAISGVTGPQVQSVVVGSAAARSGLRAGDTITAVNGDAVFQPTALLAALRTAPPGSTVTLTVLRAGTHSTLELRPEPEAAGG